MFKAVVAATTSVHAARAACPPMDYALVFGKEDTTIRNSPVVAFRLDPDNMNNFGDALIASNETGSGVHLSYYSQKICKVATHYSVNMSQEDSYSGVRGLAFLANGKSPHAVMLTYDSADPNRQVLTLIENPNASFAKLQGYKYYITIPNLKTAALTDNMRSSIISNFNQG